ncbi:hypothetical protein MA03_01350 [Infirmifilum uzonense]|uniref:DUF4443 domain-containing protein n=1 Tax=Infirmifilum uzonense TaxID=1550241 RepID=A0A0F7FGK5_9CREN|nr:DUF4443 domain-containing protein [Infirmifilum uzonense]AKG38204.1 hypothetical protein MA03_01350 [Infirmifilum uzonense]
MSIGSSRSQLLVMLFLYVNQGYSGRVSLARTLGLGEGRLRGLLSQLSTNKWVVKGRAGTKLSAKGLQELEYYLLKKGVTRLFLGEADELGSKVAVIAETILPYTGKVKILELRDEAVRGGAKGALILTYHEGKLRVPPIEEDLCFYAVKLCREVLGNTHPREGSMVFIVFAESLGEALSGFVNILESKHYGELSHLSMT